MKKLEGRTIRHAHVPFQRTHATSDDREDDIKRQGYLDGTMRLGLIPRPQGVSFPHQNYGMQLMNLILLHVTDIQSLMHENYKELHLNE